jgi:methylated-DNA-[protein]-cysteine S-methyltransferase
VKSPSEFQQKVYEALKKIPIGKVTTYKALAEYIDCNSAQAIGQALKKNPFAPEVPCHRVIKSDLTLGGYIGALEGGKIQQKLDLLKAEGVIFADGKLLDLQQVFTFDSYLKK